MKDRDLRRIVELLRTAVDTAASVDWQLPDVIYVVPKRGSPTTLRVIPWRHTAYQTATPSPQLLFLRRHTRKDLDHLRRSGASFVSLAGAVRLDVPGLFIDRTDFEIRRAPSYDSARNPFSDRASMIPRTLFSGGHGRQWSFSELAEHAGVANSTCSYVVRELDRLGLVQLGRAGRAKTVALSDPYALVEVWSQAYDWRRNTRLAVSAPVGSPRRFIKRLKGSTRFRFAATLHTGADSYLKHTPVEKVYLYVDVDSSSNLEWLIQEQEWHPAQDGALVLMTPYYRRSLWRIVRDVQGTPVVSVLQLILDLWHHPVRGRETAQLLLRRYDSERMRQIG